MLEVDTETVIYIVLDIILAILVIFGNILVCCVILHSPLFRKKTMYIFVTSLALADMFVGITAIPFGILTKLGIPQNTPKLCVLMLSFIMISTQISIFNMMAISIERYLAICHARFHFTKFHPKTSLIILAITWIMSIIVGLLPVLGWNKVSELQNDSIISISTSQTSYIKYNHSTSSLVANASSQPNSSSGSSFLNSTCQFHTHCKFIEIMHEDYMFFNFVACVLPPLFVCAVLYLVIFLSLRQSKLSFFTINAKFSNSYRRGYLYSKPAAKTQFE